MRVAVEQRNLMEAHVQAKRIYNLLNEVLDVSRQMADALDRNDQVSVQVLLSMRQEPINSLEEANLALKQQCMDLPSVQDRTRLSELLHGAEANDQSEMPLVNQIASNKRLFKQVIDLDRVLSSKLSRGKSIYSTN